MLPTSDDVYKQIDNNLYNEQANTWWDENQCLHLLKSSVNPVRVGSLHGICVQASPVIEHRIQLYRVSGICIYNVRTFSVDCCCRLREGFGHGKYHCFAQTARRKY